MADSNNKRVLDLPEISTFSEDLYFLTEKAGGVTSKIRGGKIKPTVDATLSQPGTAADAKAVGDAITSEAGARTTAINTAITNEVSARNTAINNAISTEVSNRNTAIGSAIETEVTNRNTAISDAIGTEVTNRNAAIDAAYNDLDERKANIDGAYEEMTVGNAEQLVSTKFNEDKGAYAYRTSGGSADIGDRKFEKLVGGTLAWNQLWNMGSGTATSEGITYVRGNGKITYSGTFSGNNYGDAYYGSNSFLAKFIAGHKYIITANSTDNRLFVVVNNPYTDMTDKGVRSLMFAPTSTPSYFIVRMRATNGTVVSGSGYVNVFDLTQMFGTVIANRIYALDQATPGAGVAWFMKYFNKDYYTYNPGELISVNAASHETVGFNQWDEEWEIYDNNRITSKNKIPVFPNTKYFFKTAEGVTGNVVYFYKDKDGANIGLKGGSDFDFTTPADCHYIKIYSGVYGTTYNHDMAINLSWSGWRDGEYEEYKKHSYPIGDVELRGLPKLDDQDNLYFEGDEYESDGKVTRKYGSITFDGTETFGIINENDSAKRFGISLVVPAGVVNDGTLVRFSKGGAWYLGDTASGSVNAIVDIRPTYIYINVPKTIFDGTAAQFAQFMANTEFVYKLVTPTEETADPYTNPMSVDDFGTEEFIDRHVLNEERDVSMPVGHETQYLANLRDKLQHLPDMAENDGLYAIEQTDKQMALKDLAPILARKADIDGYYEELTAGSAEQLISSQFVEDSVPYVYRTSGGSKDIGNRAMEEIVGGTVVWNQLSNPANVAERTSQGLTYSVTNGILSITGTSTGALYSQIGGTIHCIENHKYFVNGYCLGLYKDNIHSVSNGLVDAGILNAPSTDDYLYQFFVAQAGRTYDNAKIPLQVFDLTQMFGVQVADRLYSMEQAQIGAGVTAFRAMFPNAYYPYNAGELISVKTSAKEVVGFNQISGKVYYAAKYNGSVGQAYPTIEAASAVTGDNPINIAVASGWSGVGFVSEPLVANNEYQFTANTYCSSANDLRMTLYVVDRDFTIVHSFGPASSNTWGYVNKRYTPAENGMRFILSVSSASANTTLTVEDMCCHLVWSGTRNGEYEPYAKHTYELDPDLELRGVPKLNAQNELYFDGDTYKADGSVTRRYGVVDLGDLPWVKNIGTQFVASYGSIMPKPKYQTTNAFVSNRKYEATPVGAYNGVDMRISFYGSQMWLTDSDFTGGSVSTYLKGVYLVYELDTPVDEEAEPYQETQIVDDFGTERFIDEREVAIPVGHNTKYPSNLRDKLQHLPSLADNDGYYMINQRDRVMSLELFRIPKAPSTNGTYVLKAAVSGGTPTYTWEEVTA